VVVMDGMGESLSAMRAAKVLYFGDKFFLPSFDHCLTSLAWSILWSNYSTPERILNS